MKPTSIIVRMPNWIGDLVMATPLLRDLRTAFPNASITAMCRKPISDLLLKDPNIDELFCFTKTRYGLRRQETRNMVQKMRKGSYDLGILLPNSFSSAWLFWTGRVKRRIGFCGHWRSWLLTDALPFPEKRKKQHLVLTYKELLRPLDIAPSETAPYLTVEADEIERGWRLLSTFGIEKGCPLIGINPGAAYGSAKCWLPERFREVTERLIERYPNHRILFFGDQSHGSLVSGICQGLPNRVVNLAGMTSLRELMVLLSLCQLLLTNDSGPMHIASALKVPLIALFGSTDEVVTGPYNGGRVIHKHVPCSPCFKRTCPIDFPCMKEIRVADVMREIDQIMDKKR